MLNHPQFTAANLLAVDPGLGLNYAFVGSAGFYAAIAAGIYKASQEEAGGKDEDGPRDVDDDIVDADFEDLGENKRK